MTQAFGASVPHEHENNWTGIVPIDTMENFDSTVAETVNQIRNSHKPKAKPGKHRSALVYQVHDKAALQPYRRYRQIYGELKYQQPVKKPQNISFMTLPTEIRLMIYQYHFVFDEPIEMWAETGHVYADQKVRRQTKGALKRTFWHRRAVNLGLLRTCKQINIEAAEIFYGENEFRFSGTNGHMVAYAYLKKIGPRNLDFFRNLTIAVPVPSNNRGMYGENWNPETWMRINEVYDRAPFPYPRDTARNRWFYARLDYINSWCALAWMLTTAHRLQTLHIVIPQPYEQPIYFHGRGTIGCVWSAFDDLVAAKPELEFHVTRIIEPDHEGTDTSLAIINILRSIGVCRVHLATFDQERRGRWSMMP